MKNMEIWEDNIEKTTNKRMLDQWVLHVSQTIKTTSNQDLDPPPLAANDHPSVLPLEMFALESGDPPSRTLTWKSLGFLSDVNRRTNHVTIVSLLHFGRSGFALSLGCQYLI
jgi:hypothetical protein